MIHGVDLVTEEFTAHGQTSYAEKIAGLHQISWKNVDLTSEERKHVPDLNRTASARKSTLISTRCANGFG
jgi:hypothetical protein